ncbi:MAG TPA: heterodisulfide reductase-related iron-sulfur binding cluster [Longimicrobiales bacterium]|nr:heterodisulfide reductase-related iron-sulfur binding cluster [Longimicrobiales bacterium]
MATTDPRRRLVAALAEEEDALLACVHCGFCLDACPTYTRTGDEGDSPRGRLYLMRAVAEGRLEPEADAFSLHIDRCLGCRACETVCPSGVRYGFLLERARDVRADAQGIGLPTRLLLAAFGRPLPARLAAAAGRALRATGLPRVLLRALPERFGAARFGLAMLEATRPWPALRSADAVRPHADAWLAAAAEAEEEEKARNGDPTGSGVAALAPVAAPRRSVHEPHVPPSEAGAGFPRPEPEGGPSIALAPGHPPAGPGRGAAAPTAPGEAAPPRLRVAVLTGCVQEGLFGRVNRATERVLRANGCQLVPAPDQRCCGALHAHAGDLDRARALARRNVDAFEATGADRVVVNAAGCGAIMKEYGELLAHDPDYAERARRLASSVRDLSELLLELGPRPGAPLPLRVTYDAPCHLYHAQGITTAPLDVLRRIPALEIVALPRADECCGGAGIYGLLHQDLGGRVLRDKVEAVESTEAHAVATPNPGCMMQIGAGLRLAGDPTAVVHPVELLDESYRRAGFYPPNH